MTAQQNALKAVAADLPIETGGSTYTEILELIKDLHQPDTAQPIKEAAKFVGEDEIRQLRESATRLAAELEEAKTERDSLKTKLARYDAERTELQALASFRERDSSRLTDKMEQLTSALTDAQEELRRVKKDHSDALSVIEQLRKAQQQPSASVNSQSSIQSQGNALEECRQAAIKDMQTAHATAISTLRASHADSIRKLRRLLTAAEKQKALLESDLDALRISSKTKATQLDRLTAELEKVEQLVSIKDEAAASLDQRISQTFEMREREWERRIYMLLKERDHMSKALLWAWGEKEVPHITEPAGSSEPTRQGYRYKFAKGKV